jgi:hypothetical protein
MTGTTLRLAISLAAMVAALIAFISIANTWIGFGAIIGILILSALVERVVWDRFTDPETRRRDLEDRVRNPPL